MAYSTVAKNELKQAIVDELEIQFGASEDSATLNKYADAMALAIAKKMYDFGFFPDELNYPP